jgi:hypothetical protein
MRTKKSKMTAVAAGLLALASLLPLPLAATAAGASGAVRETGDAAELDRIVAAVIAAQGGSEKLTRHQNGKAVIYETTFHDFRPVAGLVFPFRLDSGVKGAPASAHIVLTSIELDPPLVEARFGKPAAPPAVPQP